MKVSIQAIVEVVQSLKSLSNVTEALCEETCEDRKLVLLAAKAYMREAMQNGHSKEFKAESDRQWKLHTARTMMADARKMLAECGEVE